MSERPDITPDMTVGALLDAYPELEELLVEIAPAFAKLRNPLLRKTVAKVTSLHQAARVGGVTLGDMIGRLREGAGLAGAGEGGPQEGAADGRPAWMDTVEVTSTHDARVEIEGGGHPLPIVMTAVKALAPGQGYVLVTPFLPAPLIDKVKEAGHEAWTEQVGAEEFRTTFRRPE